MVSNAQPEPERRIALTAEGGGTVATCKAAHCGYLTWDEVKATALARARAHKCRKVSR